MVYTCHKNDDFAHFGDGETWHCYHMGILSVTSVTSVTHALIAIPLEFSGECFFVGIKSPEAAWFHGKYQVSEIYG